MTIATRQQNNLTESLKKDTIKTKGGKMTVREIIARHAQTPYKRGEAVCDRLVLTGVFPCDAREYSSPDGRSWVSIRFVGQDNTSQWRVVCWLSSPAFRAGERIIRKDEKIVLENVLFVGLNKAKKEISVQANYTPEDHEPVTEEFEFEPDDTMELEPAPDTGTTEHQALTLGEYLEKNPKEKLIAYLALIKSAIEASLGDVNKIREIISLGCGILGIQNPFPTKEQK